MTILKSSCDEFASGLVERASKDQSVPIVFYSICPYCCLKCYAFGEVKLYAQTHKRTQIYFFEVCDCSDCSLVSPKLFPPSAWRKTHLQRAEDLPYSQKQFTIPTMYLLHLIASHCISLHLIASCWSITCLLCFLQRGSD